MLYRSTDCLCRRGAAVEYLAHSASLHSLENNAPSNPGTKHLARVEAVSRTTGRLIAHSEKGEVTIAFQIAPVGGVQKYDLPS
jgi:hypothetical protein